MLNRALTGLSYSKTSYSKRRMSEERLIYTRKPVKVTIQSRPTTWPDLTRPPFLLVKSFFNLRHLDTEYDAKHVSQATEELSFKPHRTLLVELMKLPDRDRNNPYLSEHYDWDRNRSILPPNQNQNPEKFIQAEPQPHQESDPIAETP